MLCLLLPRGQVHFDPCSALLCGHMSLLHPILSLPYSDLCYFHTVGEIWRSWEGWRERLRGLLPSPPCLFSEGRELLSMETPLAQQPIVHDSGLLSGSAQLFPPLPLQVQICQCLLTFASVMVFQLPLNLPSITVHNLFIKMSSDKPCEWNSIVSGS